VVSELAQEVLGLEGRGKSEREEREREMCHGQRSVRRVGRRRTCSTFVIVSTSFVRCMYDILREIRFPAALSERSITSLFEDFDAADIVLVDRGYDRVSLSRSAIETGVSFFSPLLQHRTPYRPARPDLEGFLGIR
jgi:hypothetical protein